MISVYLQCVNALFTVFHTGKNTKEDISGETRIMTIIRRYFIFLLPLFFLAPDYSYAFEYRLRPLPGELKISAGSDSFITLEFEIPVGTHIYGNPLGPGTGKATVVSVKDVPPGIIIDAVRYPEGKIYFSPGDRGYVRIYEGRARIFVPVKAESNVVPGRKTIDLHVDSLICTDTSCIPRESTLKYFIQVLPTGAVVPAPDSTLEDEFRRAKSIADHPEKDDKVTTPARAIPYEFQPMYFAEESVTNVIQAILLGLLAGLILNFMPCVLPVVSLKVMGFVSMGHEDRKEVFRMGLLFSLGILSVFLLLAGLAAFLGYGWGELFKQKSFIIAMIAVIFALGLAMFEVYIINPPSISVKAPAKTVNPYFDSFAKGILATLLATPCSGPFLGGTLAWALQQPPLIIFVIFTSVGTGMALPYMILAMNPSLLKFIPRPGQWTITLERIMGFLLMGTVAYLIGVLESTLVVPTLWFLLFIAIGFWQYGKYGSPINSGLRRVISAVFLVLLISFGYYLSYHAFTGERPTEVAAEQGEFTLERLIENNNHGKVTVVKFTADWCPNCTLVERTSLYTEGVIKLMKDNGVELLVADITRPNTTAEALMIKLGTRSVPFLAVFPPGDQFTRPFCLRDMYRETDVISAIERSLKLIPDVDINSIRFRQ